MSKRKIVFGICGIIFGLTFGILLAELLLRVAAPAWLVGNMKDLYLARNVTAFGSDVGWSVESLDGHFVRFVPNTHFDVKYFEYNHSVQIDQWGGRRVREVPKKKDARLVPFVGDSFTFGLGVKDDETYVSLLNQKSPDLYLNLGVPGSALPNHIDQIEFRHKELGSPAVYVFSFFEGNDYMDIFHYYSRTAKKPQSAAKPRGKLVEWLEHSVYRNRFFARSYLLQYLKYTVLKRYFAPENPVWNSVPPGCGRPAGTNWAVLMMSGKKKCIGEIRAYTKMAVDEVERASRRLHFTPIFIIIPDKIEANRHLREAKAAHWKLDPAKLDPQLPSRIIEEELTSHGIAYFDVAECLQEKPELYYKVDDHFTPAGHRAVAECLSGKLEEKIAQM